MITLKYLAVAAISIASVFAASCGSSGQTSFAGANLYYAAGLSTNDQHTLCSAMQSANMKVLRVWLDGQSTATTKVQTGPSNSTFDDTVLNLLDGVMVNAHSYGIKLLISTHSFNALSRPDVYGAWYGTGYFYEQTAPQQEFDNRLVHILNHVHTTVGKPWSQLPQYIFAFEAENEAMIGKGLDYITAHQQWQCDRATTIKNVLGSNSGILVVTGGESWLSESVQPDWFSCATLDVISIHAYGTGDLAQSTIAPYVQQAQSAGKKLLFEEWGACYYNTANNNCPSGTALSTSARNSNIQTWASAITAAGVPWMYWQVLPNTDPHYGSDFEIGVTDPSWPTLEAAAQAAGASAGAFDFSAYLL
ncbi:glycoside hydrolase family 5 protein [Sistotremastrum niveocremeum HHB9708]|uniref:mannan endo-1,4-beta-mannosidase n=1 Tax=Sistotremastrum niveocremeum HHB9708 TaxID=1314777 RepID=A0A164QL45_9AGAM|nr:glycoside hydrolase family 5 protein [Sistotremastrum niveocremeum HHB9708]